MGNGLSLDKPSLAFRLPAASHLLFPLLVLAAFLERFQREWYTEAIVPVPSAVFFGAIVLLALVLWGQMCLGRGSFRGLSRGDLLVLSLLVTVVIAFVGASYTTPRSTIAQFGKTFLHLMFVAAAAMLIGRAVTWRSLRWILELYLVIAVATAGIGLLQFWDQNIGGGGISEALKLSSIQRGTLHQPASIFSEPAFFSYVMLDAIVICTFYGHRTRHQRYLVAAAICAIALFSTMSLGGMAGFALLLAVLFRHRRFRPFVIRSAAWVLASLLLLSASSQAFSEAFRMRVLGIFTGQEASLITRLDINMASLEVWKKAPVTGVGLGNIRFYIVDELSLPRLVEKNLKFAASNAYLGMLTETDIVGLAALLLFFWHLLRRHRLRWMHDPSWQSTLAETIWTLLVINMATLLIVGTLFWPRLWLFIGLQLFVLRRVGQVPPARTRWPLTASVAPAGGMNTNDR